MSVMALFHFITDPTVTEDIMDKYLDAVSNKMTQELQSLDPEQEVQEEVFKQAYIPRRLAEVKCISITNNSIPTFLLKMFNPLGKFTQYVKILVSVQITFIIL